MIIFIIASIILFILLVMNEIKRLANSIQDDLKRKRKGREM